MKKSIILSFLIFLSYCCSSKAQTPASTINLILNKYVATSGSASAGMMVGVIDCNTDKIRIFSSGAIDKSNDLRLVCPASKPAITYLMLKEGIDIQNKIDRWFPQSQGYQKSSQITIKMLLSNTSGIKDYIGLIDKDRVCSSQFTVDIAYKNKNLAFNPGDSVLYSNTGFNAAGIILERETNKTVNELLKERFKDIASSIRMDDGKGNYPKGYTKPWPYHYSQAGFSGGLIGKIEDYLKMMAYITKQPEFKIMTSWVKEVNELKWGLGVFGQGNNVIYSGNSGANLSFFIKIDSKIIYVHTTNELDYNKFQGYVNDIIPVMMQI